MGDRSRPTRQFVPPPMPTPPAYPQASTYSTYVPPKYSTSENRTLRRTLLVWGICAAVIILCVVIFVQLMTTRQMREYEAAKAMVDRSPDPSRGFAPGSAPAEGASAQPAAATMTPQASGAGWVGTLTLPDLHAVITIRTIADDTIEAGKFAASYQEHVSLAVLLVDNSAATSELIVDTAHSTLQFADGSSAAALDARKVYGSSRRDASATAVRLSSPPYHCPAGQPVITKMLFMPPGTDTRRLRAVTLSINDQPKTVDGEFVSDLANAPAKK